MINSRSRIKEIKMRSLADQTWNSIDRPLIRLVAENYGLKLEFLTTNQKNELINLITTDAPWLESSDDPNPADRPPIKLIDTLNSLTPDRKMGLLEIAIAILRG